MRDAACDNAGAERANLLPRARVVTTCALRLVLPAPPLADVGDTWGVPDTRVALAPSHSQLVVEDGSAARAWASWRVMDCRGFAQVFSS